VLTAALAPPVLIVIGRVVEAMARLVARPAAVAEVQSGRRGHG
jgi:hypothetical protein